MNKELLDIGTKKLEFSKKGTGKLIVVIEGGLGASMDQWNYIFEEVSKLTTTIIYHRSGYGRSTVDIREERTITEINKDLNSLLVKEGIDSDIILVGHSFGGYLVKYYSNNYTDKVKGLVLVDPSPIEYDQIENLKKELKVINEKYNTNRMIEKWKAFSKMSKDELIKEFNLQTENLSVKEKIELEFMTNPSLYNSMVLEFNNVIKSSEEKEILDEIFDIPVNVLIRDSEVEINKLVNNGIPKEEAKALEDIVQNLIRSKNNLSNKVDFIEANNCGHNIHIDNPEIIITAIKNILKKITI